ncbi:hypothetical protein [Streptomyces griseocarneus]|uniref:hypothetical protein n=1 Tax=Streptomyces griseocarneus TaxID=51201 RepID=UPI00167CF20E|nr:hypothetical protein [Streptomyces griseocarneus]MBZ6476749.1 hypothetical protein [Streptomyces griseocarneus]GHG80702.1 hypothetical protein GCM10018779_62490 [Streptomyces griseocarneus]
MRRLRLPTRRPRPAVLLTAGLATAALATFGHTYDGQNAGATFGTPGCSFGVEWRGSPGLFGSCTGTDPGAKPTPDEIVTAFNDGFTDGRADALGDDNRNGRIDEDESGWDCHTMGNRVCGTRIVADECKGAGAAVDLCVTVASRPPYGWTNADGSRADNPDGRARIRDLEEKPGTPGFPEALRALDADRREHH